MLGKEMDLAEVTIFLYSKIAYTHSWLNSL